MWAEPESRGRPVVALALLGAHAETDPLERACARAGLPLRVAGSFEEAMEILQRENVPVAFYDLSRRDRPWQDAVATLSAQGGRPSIVVLSDRLNQALRDQMIRNGGYELLRTTPEDGAGLECAVRRGWMFWRNHKALRDTLAEVTK